MNDDRGCLACSKMLLNWKSGGISCSEEVFPYYRLDPEDGQSITSTEGLFNLGRVCPLFEKIPMVYKQSTFVQMIDAILELKKKPHG